MDVSLSCTVLARSSRHAGKLKVTEKIFFCCVVQSKIQNHIHAPATLHDSLHDHQKRAGPCIASILQNANYKTDEPDIFFVFVYFIF
jgi:hypothetical protein